VQLKVKLQVLFNVKCRLLDGVFFSSFTVHSNTTNLYLWYSFFSSYLWYSKSNNPDEFEGYWGIIGNELQYMERKTQWRGSLLLHRNGDQHLHLALRILSPSLMPPCSLPTSLSSMPPSAVAEGAATDAL
jgi:hypothetical protein